MIHYQKTLAVLFLLVGIAVMLQSCGEEGGTGSGPVLGPGSDRPVGIETGGADVSLSPTLRWHAIGEPGDSVVYDAYFGVSSNPGLVQANISDTSYDAGPLMPGTKYYWAIGARINGAATGKSNVYSFTTRTGITYPVAVGNRWEYRREWNALSSELGYFVIDVPRTDTGWQVEPVYLFDQTWFDFGRDTLVTTTQYLHVNASGLYRAGYDGVSNITPTSASDDSYRYIFNDREFRSVISLFSFVDMSHAVAFKSPNDLIIEIPPKLGLKYPIEVGAEWVFTDDPWPIEKQVEEFEIIEVPAGDFGCFVVRWLEDTNNDGEFDANLLFYDYIAEQGLVRRSITFKDVLVIDEHGNELGFIDITDDYELVSWEVK